MANSISITTRIKFEISELFSIPIANFNNFTTKNFTKADFAEEIKLEIIDLIENGNKSKNYTNTY